MLPQLCEVEGLLCVESGQVPLHGAHLSNISASVDGQPVSVELLSETLLGLTLEPHVPGGRCDVSLTSEHGTSEWPAALARYPVLSAPASVPLGEPLSVELENGEAGGFLLGVSGKRYGTPAPFVDLGWFHGLELNGVWIVAAGLFPSEAPEVSVPLTGVQDPELLGLDFYLQAWASQPGSGHAGFTATATVTTQ